jgi:outer membrane protein insertion porin family
MEWKGLGVVLVLAGTVAPAARAQPSPAVSQVEALLGRPIASVVVETERQPVTAPEVLALVETRAGEPLSMTEVRESVLHLATLGRFDRVRVDARAEGTMVALSYRLVETRYVTRVSFRGDLAVPRRRLRQALGNRALGVLTEDRLHAAERALQLVYESSGYFGARIASTIEDRPDPTRSRLVFAIDAGDRARVGRIDVDAEGITRGELLARLRLAPGDLWNAPRLEQRADRIIEALRAEGYYEARITWSAQRGDNPDAVDVTVEARTGPLVELVFDSEDIPERRLREFVPVEREGAVDEDLLEDSKRRIESWLYGEGYARSVVEYDRTLIGNRIRLRFRVRRGPLVEVEQVDVDGVDPARRAEVHALVQLRPGEPYSADSLAASAAAVTSYYRVRGFAAVRVDTVPPDLPEHVAAGRHLVRPRLIVNEGERTTVGRIVLNGAAEGREGELRALMGLKPSSAFYPPQLIADRNAVYAYYLNRGYRESRVDAIPHPSGQERVIDIAYEITEGPQFVIGHVLVSGNTRTSTATIVREIGLTPGEPVGVEDLTEAQRRLTALGLFRRVQVEEVPRPGRLVTDVVVNVEEAPPTNIGYGMGVEGGRRLVRDPAQADTAVEKLELSPRGFFEIGRRNLWGKNRSVNLFTRFSLRDRGGSATTSPEDTSAFYEFRVVGTYREPRVLGQTVDAQVNGFVEQGVRSSFNFARQGVNAEMARHFGRGLTLAGRYSFGKTRLFDQRLVAEEKPVIDRLFPQVRLSTLSAVMVQDRRDDPLDPTSGYLTNVESDLAVRALGSEVGFVKGFAQGFIYRRLPGVARTVFAGGLRVGLATGFGIQVQTDEQGQPLEIEVKDLPASERFYAGGSTTVRGYALDRLGDDATIDSDGFPRGGNALVIANAELRFPVWGAFGGVLFVDAGNVFARFTDLDLGRIKASTGAGVRYRSPIGPIRVDVGLKLNPRRLATGRSEGRWELHISIGQAF